MRVTSDRAAGCVTLSHRLEARNNRTQLAQDGGARAARFSTVFEATAALGIVVRVGAARPPPCTEFWVLAFYTWFYKTMIREILVIKVVK